MSIEVSNTNITGTNITGQAVHPGGKSADDPEAPAKSSLEQPTAEANKSTDSVQLTDDAQQLHKLQTAITSQPAVDQSKVANAKMKIENKTLGILGNIEERLASAENIANKLLTSEMELNNKLP